jgi:hypothetical protein
VIPTTVPSPCHLPSKKREPRIRNPALLSAMTFSPIYRQPLRSVIYLGAAPPPHVCVTIKRYGRSPEYVSLSHPCNAFLFSINLHPPSVFLFFRVFLSESRHTIPSVFYSIPAFAIASPTTPLHGSAPLVSARLFIIAMLVGPREKFRYQYCISFVALAQTSPI